MVNVLSPRNLVFRPDIMDETVKSSSVMVTVFTHRNGGKSNDQEKIQSNLSDTSCKMLKDSDSHKSDLI